MFERDELLKIGAIQKTIRADEAIPSGARVGKTKYIVIKTLHRGNETITYLAKNSADRKPVVIKEFFPKGSFVYDGVEMFLLRDDQLNLKLKDANPESLSVLNLLKTQFQDETTHLMKLRDYKEVVDVLEGFEVQGTVYRVLTYLTYPTLNQFINRKLLMPKEALYLYKNILKAVMVLHQENLTHKGLDPKGIFLTDTAVILTDFSMLKDRKPTLMNQNASKDYLPASTEYISDTDIDLYSLGLILEVILESIGYKKDKFNSINMGKVFNEIPVDYYLEQTLLIDGTSKVKTLEACLEMMSPMTKAHENKSNRFNYILAFIGITLTCMILYFMVFKATDEVRDFSLNNDDSQIVLVNQGYYQAYDFNEEMIYDLPYNIEGANRLLLTHEETQRTIDIVENKRRVNLSNYSLNPGSYCLKINNEFSRNFKILDTLKTQKFPMFDQDSYAYYLNEDQWLTWSEGTSDPYHLRILNQSSGELSYHLILKDHQFNLNDLSLKLGSYQLSISQGENSESTSYHHSQLVLHRASDLKSPMLYSINPKGIKSSDSIHWVPTSGQVLLKWVSRENKKTYEMVAEGRGSFLVSNLSLKAGAYDLYVCRLENNQTSNVIKKQVIIEQP